VAIALLRRAVSRFRDLAISAIRQLVWKGEDRRFQFGGVLQLTGLWQLAGAVIMIVKLPLGRRYQRIDDPEPA
jgi:hypothetical protein